MPFDPNGCIYWKGKFHIFYIFQEGLEGAITHHWGHASSSNLIHWTYHPPALAPTNDSPEKGIFSGCAFLDREGLPVIAYYGIGAGICLAFANDDDLINWSKSPNNPVIPEPKRGDPLFDVYRVFDPHVWVEQDVYHAILGGQVKPHNQYDTAYLFTSTDLVHWDYQRPFYNPNPQWTEAIEDCACPDFFRLDDTHVLMCISHTHGTRYYLGNYQNGTFVTESHHRMNFPGGSCFASESLVDQMGRRIVWAWALSQLPNNNDYFSVMTMPRVLSTDTAKTLTVEPVRELELLRKKHRKLPSFSMSDETRTFFDYSGRTQEFSIAIESNECDQFGLIVCSSPNRIEETRILFDLLKSEISIDTSDSSLDKNVYRAFPIIAKKLPKKDIAVQTASHQFEDSVTRIRLFIDESIMELYVDRHLCLTQRVYPTLANSRMTRLFVTNGSITVHQLEAWEMSPLIYTDGT